MTTEPLTLGSRLRKLREARGLTGEEACAKCNISPGTLSRYERDHVDSPNWRIMERLARLYGVSLDELGELTKGKT